MTKLNASKRPNNANYSLRKRLQNHRIQKQEQILNKNVKADRFASLPGSSNNEKYGLDSSQTKTKKKKIIEYEYYDDYEDYYDDFYVPEKLPRRRQGYGGGGKYYFLGCTSVSATSRILWLILSEFVSKNN